ncbi:DUF1206 domain-containing protein [Actinotalea sp. AC32]|nr:DUF1206 domain-containing protein [Actinotalea sp. AC32]
MINRGARAAADNPVVTKGWRLGHAANGVVHVLIGWIALQIAFGSGGGEQASASGALETLAGTPGGAVLLWIALVGFALLGFWEIVSAVLGTETKDRVKDGAKGVAHLVLAGLTLQVVTGSGGGGGGTQSMTAQLMAQPAGRVLVALVGLGAIAVGGYHLVKGWRKKFLRDLRETPPSWVVQAGRAGYVARGVAVIILGGLFVAAAATADPERAQGLDGALMTLREAPFGKVLLALVALGFVAFGVYSFARAKYARGV